jgi:hypothetical protein
MVGVHRHPGDLGGVVEVALEGQEADHGVVDHGGKAGLAADGLGAFPPAVFLAEVIGQAGDDLVAARGVIAPQRSDLDRGLGIGHGCSCRDAHRRLAEAAVFVLAVVDSWWAWRTTNGEIVGTR